jgi:hypothetical protein
MRVASAAYRSRVVLSPEYGAVGVTSSAAAAAAAGVVCSFAAAESVFRMSAASAAYRSRVVAPPEYGVR